MLIGREFILSALTQLQHYAFITEEYGTFCYYTLDFALIVLYNIGERWDSYGTSQYKD
jgi:hypothetical protein